MSGGMESISLLIAFGAGVLSFVSPCMVPLVPAYLASLAGPDIIEGGLKVKRFSIFLHALCFVAGFGAVFTLLGAAAGLAGLAVGAYLPVLRPLAGGLIVVFGLLMLGTRLVPWLNYERRFSLSLASSAGYLRSFLVGALFPIAWIPCSSIVLGGVLTMAGTSETAGKGAFLLAAYSLGMGLPFLALGVAFDSLRPFLRRVSRYSRFFHIASGVLLVGLGVLILTNNLTWLQSRLGTQSVWGS